MFYLNYEFKSNCYPFVFPLYVPLFHLNRAINFKSISSSKKNIIFL